MKNKMIHGLDVKPNGYYDGSRSEMLSFVPLEDRKILEVGCGSGVFGRQLKTERKAEVWGVELYKAAAEEAQMKLDKVIVGNIEMDDIDLPGNYFDCVIFNDVLEHLKDPWAVLKRTHSILNEKGCVVASIPNIRHFPILKRLVFDQEWEYVDAGILDKTHLRFFTQKSIEDLFNVCKYKVLKIEGINGIEFPWKFRLFNQFMNDTFEDARYLQFACIAQKIDDRKSSIEGYNDFS